MELWQLKYYMRFRFTKEQKKAMAGKIPMTEKLFLDCFNVFYCRLDGVGFRWLMMKYPQFMRKFHEDYERRLEEDPDFREEQEKESQRLKQMCLEEFGEEWVKENWRT